MQRYKFPSHQLNHTVSPLLHYSCSLHPTPHLLPNNTTPHNTTQHNTTQHNTTQHNTTCRHLNLLHMPRCNHRGNRVVNHPANRRHPTQQPTGKPSSQASHLQATSQPTSKTTFLSSLDTATIDTIYLTEFCPIDLAFNAALSCTHSKTDFSAHHSTDNRTFAFANVTTKLQLS